MDGVSWQVVAILCSAILALVGTITGLTISRFSSHSSMIGEIAKATEVLSGVQRAQAAEMKAFRELIEARVTDTVDYYRHNIPELFAKWEKLERSCLERHGGKK